MTLSVAAATLSPLRVVPAGPNYAPSANASLTRIVVENGEAVELLDAARIFGFAMTPIGELRFSIPYGVLRLDAPWLAVLGISILGNMVPVFFLLLILDRVGLLLERYPNPLGRLLQWRTRQIHSKYQDRFLRWGAPALVLLVAIPLPFTGVWTGSLAAWVFRVPFRIAIPLIFAGVVIAGVVVAVITVGGVQLGEWMLEYQA